MLRVTCIVDTWPDNQRLQPMLRHMQDFFKNQPHKYEYYGPAGDGNDGWATHWPDFSVQYLPPFVSYPEDDETDDRKWLSQIVFTAKTEELKLWLLVNLPSATSITMEEIP